MTTDVPGPLDGLHAQTGPAIESGCSPAPRAIAQREWGVGGLAVCIGLAAAWVEAAGAQAVHPSHEQVAVTAPKPLWVDRTEVTIQSFARYVQSAGVVTQAERDGGGFEYVGGWQRRPGWTWRTPDGTRDVNPLWPAVHLTQAEAAGYCAWAGGRLPTAAEWRQLAYTESRAQPPAPWVAGRTYPWPTGDSPAGANTADPDPWPRAAPAGATREGVNGLFDMGANVWEWAADARGDDRPTLGGSWWYGAHQMGASVDAWKPANFYAVYIGFRCVYDRAPRARVQP